MTGSVLPMRLLSSLFAAVLLSAPAARGGQASSPPLPDASMAPREVQRLFDAYVLMQAQERLGVSDAQYPQFVQRLKTLLDTRRRTQSERATVLQDLARGTSGQTTPALDEAGIRDRLRRLREIDDRGAADLRQAYDALDQVLDVKQQARFRVFEEQMERRKVELLLRARQAARARRGAQPVEPQ